MKNCVMNTNIDLKVVMDLSVFKTGGWNKFATHQSIFVEEFTDENGPWLLIGIPRRDPFLVTQYLERHSLISDQHVKYFDVTS